MPRNVELKARVADPAGLRARVAALADQGPEVLEQRDLFFGCASGRLKLRTLAPDYGELIFYRRADRSGPTLSTYRRTPTDVPRALAAVLRAALPVVGEVRKRRTVYHRGRTRIHLDEVEGLGTFLELEAVLDAGEAAATGRREVERIARALGVDPRAAVASAYIDLLTHDAASRPLPEPPDSPGPHGDHDQEHGDHQDGHG